LSFFELWIYKYNCSFGLEDSLLPLTKVMSFLKKPLDKRGKAIWKRKQKTHVMIVMEGPKRKAANVVYRQNI
jgi:hypothetical protein